MEEAQGNGARVVGQQGVSIDCVICCPHRRQFRSDICLVALSTAQGFAR